MTLEERARECARDCHLIPAQSHALILAALVAVDAEATEREREAVVKILYEISESKPGLFKMTIQMAADRIQKGERPRDTH